MNIEQMKKRLLSSHSIFIYSHLDIDGLTSAALFIRFLNKNGYKGDLNISITQPFYLANELKKAKNYDYVVVMDLGLDIKSYKVLSKLKYYVFDHHERTLKYKNGSIYVNLKKSASMIIYDIFSNKNDEFDLYLSKLGGASDKVLYDVNYGKRSVIISSAMKYNISNKWFVYHILGMFINGVDPYEDLDIKYQARMMKQAADVVYLDYEDLSDLYTNIKVRYYSDGYNFSSFLTDTFSKEFKDYPVFVITQVPGTEKLLITARSYSKDYNVRSVISKISDESDSIVFGGHNRAASCVINAKDYERMFILLKEYDGDLNVIKRSKGS